MDGLRAISHVFLTKTYVTLVVVVVAVVAVVVVLLLLLLLVVVVSLIIFYGYGSLHHYCTIYLFL